MSTVVRFAPELGRWIQQQLDLGRSAPELLRTMIDQRMPDQAAQAIVDAFVDARRRRVPPPLDSVTLADANDYVYGGPIIAEGNTLDAGDRLVPVLARVHAPVLALLGDVLSAEECAELIALARPRLRPSTVVDPASGADVVAEHRNSLGMFFKLAETDFIARIDRRISKLMNLPIENGEGLQLLYYPEGAQNSPHFDFLQSANAANRASIARSGQRVATLITYLNDVEAGGETIFPETGWRIVPRRGNAVHFEYCNAQGQLDLRSLHGSLPVQRGEKWVMTKWMRQQRFVPAGSAASEGMMR